jgi:hypothetical protein
MKSMDGWMEGWRDGRFYLSCCLFLLVQYASMDEWMGTLLIWLAAPSFSCSCMLHWPPFSPVLSSSHPPPCIRQQPVRLPTD